MSILRCCGEKWKPDQPRVKVEVTPLSVPWPRLLLSLLLLGANLKVVSLHQISPPTASATAVQPASVVCGWLNSPARSAAERDTNAASPIAYKP
jgi:hypothetical protein